MQFSAHFVFVSLVAALQLETSEASAFLGKQARTDVQTDQDVLMMLEEELGKEHGRTDEARVKVLQEELRHTFASLPKNSFGNLQAAGARYALHRLFVQRHAWQLTGLNPGGESWENSTASDALGDRVPRKVRTFFEERLGEAGVSLHELAVLASLLESMIHTEIEDRLSIAMAAMETNGSGSLDQTQATDVLHAYMASYVLGVPLKKLSPQSVRKHVKNVGKLYPTWADTQHFVDNVRNEIAPAVRSYNFSLLSDVLAEVGDRYGRWQSRECSELKGRLVKLESRSGTGRVLLSDFYGSALSGENWQFTESLDYLRQLGALDESSPSQPSVIIPNYIGSPSNCVASSGYYSVCCLDECEDLMDHLERDIGAPTASVADIRRVLSTDANATLSASVLKRLDEVAEHHGGFVALHGRLFAQWMHHAFPRECPFPHVTGTINPMQAEDFAAQTGAPVTATKEEMRQFAEAATTGREQQPEEEPEDGLCSNMWSMEEELVDPRAHAAHQEASQQTGRKPLKSIMFCLALASIAATIVKTAMSLAEDGREEHKAAKTTRMTTAAARREDATTTAVTYSV